MRTSHPTLIRLLLLLLLGLASPALADPTLTAPPPDLHLPGETVTFTWADNGTAVVEWWIFAGTIQGANDLADSQSLPSATRSYTIEGLPANGIPIWIQLWWRLATDQSWHARDTLYQAAAPPPMSFPGGPGIPKVTFTYTVLESNTDEHGEPLTNLESTELRVDVEGDPYEFFYFTIPATAPTGGGSPSGQITIPLDLPEGAQQRVMASVRSVGTNGKASLWTNPIEVVGPFTLPPVPDPAPGQPRSLMLSVMTCLECQVNVTCVDPCQVTMTPTPPAEGGDPVP